MLPAELYHGEAAFRADRERVFRRTWQFLGHAADLARPGDYIADVVGGAPVVVVVKPDGALAGFHNVCRHRAGALVADGTGNCGEAFTCRYHGWRYALDGRLRSATDFGALEGFDPRAFGLFPIRVETWRGLVFVNLDPAAGPLSGLVAPLEGRWAAELPDFPLTERRTHLIACNWKTYVENYLEGYHLPMVHPEFDADIVVADYAVEIEGHAVFHAAPPREAGVNAGRWAWLWPNLAINAYRHGYMLERMVAVGPETTRLDYFYFFDPARPAELAEMFVSSDRIVAQDKQVCEEVQRNLMAGIYPGGVFSPKHEQAVAWFQRELARAGAPAALIPEEALV
jgi:choline monooxygenase